MKPPADSWAPWLYRAAMAVISSFAMAMLTWVAWQVIELARTAPAAHRAQAFELLGWLLLGLLGLLWLQQIGLVARNLVRNLKLQGPGGMALDVNSHGPGKEGAGNAEPR